MKTLKKLKIINWHYFWNETIDFGGINFLTGLNASGKSTLIDAIQVLLLGDTSGRFFNKAAMDKSNRTLKGYLRGELGDNLDGGFHYLRNGRFSSYIAMEFFDDKNATSFTMGIVFDIYDDGEEEHRFFEIDAPIPENQFIINRVPMDYKQLNSFLSSNYAGKFTFFDSNRQYQEYLKRSFGGLKDKYFSLLKKSISFTPITDITTFITEYVCDPQQNVDIAPMQENILQYRKLEKEAQIMRERVNRLEAIHKTYKMYQDNFEQKSIYSYIVEKASFQNDRERLDSYYHQIDDATKRLAAIDVDIAEVEHSISELNRKKMHLIQDKANSDIYRITDDLRAQKANEEKRLLQLNETAKRINENLSRYVSNFISVGQSLADTLTSFDVGSISDDALLQEINDLRASALDVLTQSMNLRDNFLGNIDSLSTDVLFAWRDSLGVFKQRVGGLAIFIGKLITNYDQKTALLKQQEIDMQGGGKSYEARLLGVKRELETELSRRHNRNIRVSIFADLIDIRHPEWANAIEGYLNNQKFNFFVDDEYYMESYEIMRSLLEKFNYYGLTIIDANRLIERDYRAEKNSLAEEIKTDHPGAEAYANFLIGRLMKCRNLTEARAAGNGITIEGDLYRNFAFGKINPYLYREHFIGREISQNQLTSKRYEITANAELVNKLRDLASIINEANRMEIINSNEIATVNTELEQLKDIKGIKENIAYVDSELSKHDLSQLTTLDKRIDDIGEDISGLESDRASLFEEKGKITNLIETLKNDKIPSEKKSVEEKENRLLENFDPFLVSEKAEPLFQEELAKGKSPLDLITEYNISLGHAQYLVNNLFTQLTKLRRDYIREYRLTYDTEQEDNEVYEAEYRDMTEVRLPDYENKIHDAYDKAVKQFKNDFISKLRSAIEAVEDQIKELNFALSASTFGEDSYRFTVRPSSTYRVYYDMIMDDLLLEMGDDDSEFLAKYDTVMRDLFAQVALANDSANNAAVLVNVEKFTDYRSYLDFDLVVKDKSGNEQRLSRMIKKKSGGETQTPFYISVLASFAQLYHVNETGELGNTLRLIIFDEAFSKMDGGRIKEAIRLLRKFGLQAIVSAPSDKVAEISGLVDETLVVLRGKNASSVRLYAEEDKLA